MIRAILRNAGVRPQAFLAAVRGWRRYVGERRRFRGMPGASQMAWGREMPILTEASEASGSLGAYFQQDVTVARWIYEDGPRRHLDVGSRIDGFVGHLSIFREVEVLDIRPQPGGARNIRFQQVDLMQRLPVEWRACTDSLSCLHTIEHFGLGRYGDPLDPLGHEKGVAHLKEMVEAGGVLYLSVPIGPERVEFNAHRVFAPETLCGWFGGDGWKIERCAVVDDKNEVLEGQGDEVLVGSRCELGVGIVAARRG